MQATLAGGIDSWAPETFTNLGSGREENAPTTMSVVYLRTFLGSDHAPRMRENGKVANK